MLSPRDDVRAKRLAQRLPACGRAFARARGHTHIATDIPERQRSCRPRAPQNRDLLAVPRPPGRPRPHAARITCAQNAKRFRKSSWKPSFKGAKVEAQEDTALMATFFVATDASGEALVVGGAAEPALVA